MLVTAVAGETGAGAGAGGGGGVVTRENERGVDVAVARPFKNGGNGGMLLTAADVRVDEDDGVVLDKWLNKSEYAKLRPALFPC